MADKKTTAKSTDYNGFQKSFRSYKSMNDGEQAAFRQGATTANNSIKEKLGLKKPR